jgi:hypothetical protein
MKIDIKAEILHKKLNAPQPVVQRKIKNICVLPVQKKKCKIVNLMFFGSVHLCTVQ